MIEYKSCRPDEGCDPKCKIGTLSNTIEIRGACLSSIIKSRDKRKPVFIRGEYSRTYNYMFVLNSPSFYDDRNGYIGNDQVFEKLIKLTLNAGINPDEVFVTYRIKCKIPKGRKATKEETNACFPHLVWEVEKFQPKVIMTFGADCLRIFKKSGIGSINSIRGTVINETLVNTDIKSTFIPTIDPSTFFYRPDENLEKRIVTDFVLAKKVIEGTYDPSTVGHNVSYKLISSFEALDQMILDIQETKFFAFDTESRSLPWHREPMICLSFCWGYQKTNEITTAVLPIYQHDALGLDWKLKSFWPDPGIPTKIFRRLQAIFESPDIAKAAHNIKYDLNVIRKHCGIQIKGFLYDTLLMHHTLFEYYPHDLEYLADIEFHTGNYSYDLHKIVGKGKKTKPYDLVPDDIMWPYTAMDVESTFRLCQLYFSRLQAKPHLWKLYCEEVEPSIKTIAKAEWHGTLLDDNVRSKLEEDYTAELDIRLINLRSQTSPDFNPGSPDQVVEIIKKAGYGEKIINVNKAKGYETSKNILLELAEDGFKLADDIIGYRNLKKMISTYLVNAKNDMDLQRRIRMSFKIHGTETARLSAGFIHQIPRVNKDRPLNLRDMFIVPNGKQMVYFDFSQIELRLFAILSNDKEMLKLYAEGKDIHQISAAMFLPFKEENITKFNRQQIGKPINFSKIYGSEGYKIVKTSTWQDSKGEIRNLTWDMYNRGMAKWEERFPNAAQYLIDIPEITRANGGVWKNPFGRERHMGESLFSRNEAERKAAEREIVNTSIQSPAGEITTRSLNLIHRILEEQINEEDIILLFPVHDSASYECTDYLTDWFSSVIKRVAERPIPELGNNSFPINLGLGKSWAEAERNAG